LVSLVMIFGALAVAVPASASPDSPPPHNCVLSFSSSVSTQSTNATVSFEATVSPSGCWTGNVYITLTWGNSTSYPFTDINNVAYSLNTVYYAPLLDYLEPSTTYYYYLHGTFGIYSGNYYGSWTTNPEANYLSKYGIIISGTVYDTTGATAPLYTAVLVTCTDYAGSLYWSVLGFTNSQGHYSLAVGHNGEPMCAYYGYGYFVVDVGEMGVAYWPGHWNETVVVWAPQVINFYVDPDQLSSPSKPVVNEMEFTHSSHAQLTACSSQVSSEEFQSTSTASGSLFGLSFNVQSTSASYTSFGTNGCISNQGEPGLEIWGEEETSRMMVFNAIESRSVSVLWEQYFGGLQNGGNAGSGNATGAPIQDWLSEPTVASQACTISGIVWLNWPIPANSGVESWGMTASGSVSGISGETWGLTVPLYLDGTDVGAFGYSNGFTVTTSESSQFSVNFIVPNSSVTQYYTVACTGGSSGSGTGIVLHVWQDAT
jgi:hypothetical protein